jgi:intracellular sulfur oxidation DsrE/DsrF family protein
MMPSIRYLILLASVSSLALSYPACAAPAEGAQTTQQNIINIEQRENISVVYDVKDDDWEAGVGKALYYVRGLLESYKSMGISRDKLHISVVMHGPTAYWLLNDTAYQKRSDDPFDYNSNEQIVRELLAHGVSVEICNASMKAKGWTEKNLLPGVTIVHDAYTRFIDLQHRGYAYIRF